jgi:two-component system phosphate regulon response regulator PhoB
LGDADGLAGVGIDDTPHILIADDVAEVREIVRFHLERAGFRVSEATGGSDALEQVRQGPPDVLLLDLTMPDVDGWKVLDVVRAEGQLQTMRVALLTAEADEMVEHRARRAGAHAYLVKPLDGADLTRAVQRLLDDVDEPA